MNKQDLKYFTWADLKKIVNKMPTSKLKDPVTLWEGELCFSIESVEIAKEDYLDTGDSSVWPRSEAKKNLSKAGYSEAKYEVVYPKGTRIIHISHE